MELTIARLLLLLPLWALAVLGLPVALAVGLAIASGTDVVDGYLARRFRTTTRLGSQLDSIADILLAGSSVLWLWMFVPELFRDHRALIGLWLALSLATGIVGWLRFRRIADLHLYTSKAAGFIGYLFIIHALVVQGYSGIFFAVLIALGLLSQLESLAVQLTRDTVDEHIGSILLRGRQRPGL